MMYPAHSLSVNFFILPYWQFLLLKLTKVNI